jgi:predicted phage terminase large subunit-like protein
MPAPADIARTAWRASPAGYGLRLIPGFQLWRHIAALSKAYVWAMTTPGARLIVNMPPQYGKSILTSLAGPVWALDHWPTKRIALASYEANFALRWGRQVRDLIVANPTDLRVRIRGDAAAAAGDWETTEGGGMLTTGAGGPLTGRSVDAMIVDDPHKNWQEAHSALIRDNVWDWWRSTVRTRLQPGAPVIVVATRWHAADLAGRLTDPKENPDFDRWRVLRLPAIAEGDDDPLGRREGEVLEPRRFSTAEVLSFRRDLGSQLFAGLYQQRPSPAGGGIIKRSWWKWYSMRPGLPRFDEIIASWDMAFKETATSSYVVGQVWGRIGADIYLLDQVRDRMDFPSTIVAVLNLSAKWPMARAKLVEDKANGPAVIATLARKVPGLIAVQVEGSKEARLHAVSPLIEAGNVFLPDPVLAPWIGDFVEELSQFPSAPHDDMVDACAQALSRLVAGIGVQASYSHEGGRR